MKKLTFIRQIEIGMILVILGHILADVLKLPVFVNLGWIGYGLLFLLHPVWDSRADDNKHIKLYVRIVGAVIVLLGCMLRSGSGDSYWQERISEKLGIDAGAGILVTSMDDHSGFHGDGTSYAVLSFESEELERQIGAPGGWKALPLTENIQTVVYGVRTETSFSGPFIDVTIPRVERGYWYFYDRKRDTASDGQVLSAGSFNYTIAIYDSDTDRLYFCEYDT